MADIVLATLNAKYAHSAFGLRYLFASLGALQARTALLEFNINQRPTDILEHIVAHKPRIVGLGVYIWNVAPTTELVQLLKALLPDTVVVLGGPEVSYETQTQEIVAHADHVITGEGEVSFPRLCASLLAGEPVPTKIMAGQMPDTQQLPLPYHLYSNEDIQQRVVYVEASRGCPFSCEFCLSSLDTKVRRFDMPAFFAAMQDLLDRGAQQFKFIDRTFNLQVAVSTAILEFFLERMRPGLFLHFEMIPDRLPAELRSLIGRFPPGVLQFEIGVQTLTPAVEARISRRQNHAKMAENFAFLRDSTGVHVHADLIVGLPGETLETLGQSFDRLLGLGPQEIQIGILKRLRGTPIVRHTQAFSMVYNPLSPYDLLANSTLDFATMQRLKRMARYWDMVINSGNFRDTAPLLWAAAPSAFRRFLHFSDWLYGRFGQTHAVALDRLAEALLLYLETTCARPDARAVLLGDYHRTANRRTPAFLAPPQTPRPTAAKPTLPRRQARHLAP